MRNEKLDLRDNSGTLATPQSRDTTRTTLEKKLRPHIITYWLKPPNGSHKSFSIWYRKKDLETSEPFEHGQFKDDRTTILNKMLKQDKKSLESVKKEFNKIVKALQENEDKLRGHLPILGENETMRAILSVGEVPLISADVHEIQKAVDNHCNGDRNKQRRTIYRLKAILKIIGRVKVSEDLERDRKIPKKPTHITYRDLPLLINHIRASGLQEIAGVGIETYVALIQFLFWSGLRIGEAMAIEENDFRPKARILEINWQITQRGKKKLPKGEKQRQGHIALQGTQFFYDWVRASDRHKLKRHEGTKKLKQFCKAIFKEQIKHITFHGLRHSYACVMMRHFEFPIESVADYIGDNIMVAKENYIGFVPDEIAFERAAKRSATILK